MPRRIIAIGDIHGCAAAFDALLTAIQPGADDLLIPLGDYVDRGPHSRQVIERLLELRSRCQLVPLLGNHEIMMLAAYEDHSQAFYWLQSGGQATLDSYGGLPTSVPESHLRFLRECVPFYETDEHFFVHANYIPEQPLSAQPEFMLYWMHLHAFRPARHASGKVALVGHTPQKEGNILRLDHLICLDTFCVGGGWLSAMDVVSGTVWQASLSGTLRTADGN
jgi:serine/threonine protein phosphatase 1